MKNPGERIKFSKCYALEAKNRIQYGPENAQRVFAQVGLNPLNIRATEGLVVGYRNSIMSEAKLQISRQTNGGYFDSPDFIQGSLNGKREKCYLVSYNPWRKLVLVRECDVI